MRITIDTDRGELVLEEGDGSRSIALYSPESFEIISSHWLKLGFTQKYNYGFTWLGRPVIQLPEDLITLQEVFFRIRPTLVIETGVAHGGSSIFFASLCKVIGSGRVIGIDVRIRPENRAAIEEHELCSLISLIEGSSTDPEVVATVSKRVAPEDSVFVFLDSNHTASHVLAELNAYAPLVTPGSYIVVCDSIMRELGGIPGICPDWRHDNPSSAVEEFLKQSDEFVLEDPPRAFNESMVRARSTYWPNGWLRRVARP